MIKQKPSLTFLITSLLAIALISTISFDSAQATLEPPGCSGNSVNPTIKVFRNDGTSDVQLTPSPNGGPAGTVDEGELIQYFVQLDQGIVNGCNYLNGTLNLLLPNATQVLVVDPVPLISNVTSFNATIPYVASIVDDVNTCVGSPNDGRINACLFYGNFTEVQNGVNGVSHSSAIGEDTAKGAVDIQVTVVGNYTVSTSSDPQNTSNSTDFTTAPVINPSDIVRIDGIEGIEGTFNVTSILNTPSGPVNGTCDAPVANSTFPQFIECSISDSFDESGDYCWDVTIDDIGLLYTTPLTIHNGTFANNECFKIAPSWNATTLTTSSGTHSDPVVDPLDVVSIVTDTGFNGTFTGNFTLGNSTDVFDTGACTGGVVNATTGEATLNCQALGTFDNTIGDTCFDVTINAPSPFTPSYSTLFGADDSANECFSITPPSWNATTLTTSSGTHSVPVVEPLDVVTIIADDNFLGNFTGNFTLGNSTDVFDSGDCTGGVVNATTGEAILNCQSSQTFEDAVGEICFDVTINAPSPYTPVTDTLFGADDSENECFEIIPSYTVETESDPLGLVDAASLPIVNPQDTIMITGTNGTFGNFTATATLTGPSGAVDAPTCTSDSGSTYPISLTCTAIANLTEPGQYFWDVMVTDESGNYDPAMVSHNGTVNNNEYFEIPPIEFGVLTLSSATGTISSPVVDPTDEISVSGTDGVFGNFTATATLTGPSGAVDAPTCTSDSGSTYPISLTCTAIANLTEPGQYCWDVTVTDESETYTPDQVVHLGLENQATECFEILQEDFEGLTPGFWKANAENWGAGAWVAEDPEDDFNTAFGTSVELRISKAKSDTDKGDSSNPTLYGALSATGGEENALARHCVAAKLNAENPDVEYPWDTATVIEECGNALNSGDKNVIEDLKNQLDEWNNLGADIDQHWSP